MIFIDEIQADISWRVAELATFKTLPFRYGMNIQHQNFLIKYSVPSIYAIWEGFVTNVFTIYIRELNMLNLEYHQLNMNILAHAVTSEDKLNLENIRNSFKSKKEFVEYYQRFISQPIQISSKIPKHSNVSFKVINEILIRFGLSSLQQSFENKLDKLLLFRNKLAHGDQSLPIKKEHIEEFSLLVQELMYELLLRIEDGYVKKLLAVDY